MAPALRLLRKAGALALLGEEAIMEIVQERGLELLSQTPLFSYLSDDEIRKVCRATNCYIKQYSRGEFLMRSGESISAAGLVLEGRVAIYTAPGYDGIERIIAEIGIGEMYGEPFNCLSYQVTPISVTASTAARVLIIDVRELFDLKVDQATSQRVLANLAIQFAEKITLFRGKVEVLSQSTLKKKILAAVKQEAEYQNTLNPVIPFTKVSFAQYLCVNRNTLARALNELEEEGELAIQGRNYRLLRPEHMLFVLKSPQSPESGIHSTHSRS